jgi:hypothetical protein
LRPVLGSRLAENRELGVARLLFRPQPFIL